MGDFIYLDRKLLGQLFDGLTFEQIGMVMTLISQACREVEAQTLKEIKKKTQK